ncbi:hypothetical protein KP509_02G091500 [Ceratopteris richardii]|uniref:Uncharacterized protein n=1 Tax=Ceratopteris richardii TaxID=49495 RepID=A0A8T2VGE2_CERRI|nr:hypothetical protein KP509_02G091500 [Ceratopteris richardii]
MFFQALFPPLGSKLQVAPLESRWTMSTGTSATISMDHMRICKLFHSR